MIAQSTVQRVHDRADILDVVSRYHVELIRKGSLHVGRCPFHQEKTGSFTVYPNRNNYHCYGCGKHGSAIDFVMEMEGISYPEAIENLANMFGIQVEHVQREQTREEISQANTSRLCALSWKGPRSSLSPNLTPTPRRPQKHGNMLSPGGESNIAGNWASALLPTLSRLCQNGQKPNV